MSEYIKRIRLRLALYRTRFAGLPIILRKALLRYPRDSSRRLGMFRSVSHTLCRPPNNSKKGSLEVSKRFISEVRHVQNVADHVVSVCLDDRGEIYQSAVVAKESGDIEYDSSESCTYKVRSKNKN